jgi:D-serine deaminase-like pyridoxal phosphate-dependent protein
MGSSVSLRYHATKFDRSHSRLPPNRWVAHLGGGPTLGLIRWRACPPATGAGTGSFEFKAASRLYTELQCGSYIFMDADFGKNRDHDGKQNKAFELYVWATVMSRPAGDRAIVDAGLKALAFDSGPEAAAYERASDEHGRLAVSAATN